MYKKIEELYKKESPYNKIKLKMFVTYLLIVLLLLIFKLLNLEILMYFLVFLTIFIMREICQRELKTKLYISFSKNDVKGQSLDEIIAIKEKQMFTKYLKKNKLFNSCALKCIVDHYRNLVKPQARNDNFWSIVAIIVSVLLAFVSKDGFNFESFEMTFPYLICVTLCIFIVLFFIRRFSELRKLIRGEDGIYERLEALFSELLIICELELLEKSNKKIVRSVAKIKRKNSKNDNIKKTKDVK